MSYPECVWKDERHLTRNASKWKPEDQKRPLDGSKKRLLDELNYDLFRLVIDNLE